MEFIYLIFHACLRFRFLDVGQTLALGVLCVLSAEYYVVMCRALPGTLET